MHVSIPSRSQPRESVLVQKRSPGPRLRFSSPKLVLGPATIRACVLQGQHAQHLTQHLINPSEYEALLYKFSDLGLVGVGEVYKYWSIALSG